ncbi:MAG: DNA polymerase III subunit gamma/tau [Candidatus Marinimicrobia bacterium]|nr:DNA polymerase III subunit gamma/tau [Candidatus Neomarinimicrobiota bacterium]
MNPCNECKNCKEITAGRSFDVREIDGASNTGVDNIRDLREEVKYPPSDGRYKIYIIDEVHMLSKSAFNALLKTLEEPPSHIKFIFATTEPEKVIPTIISRTQRFDFKRIPLPKIIGLLTEICEAEGIEISDGALTLIARKADGSMRDAESLLDQVISFSGEKITDESVATILGIVSYELYLQLSDILHGHDVPAVLDLITEVMSAGYDLSEFLDGLADYWRNLLVLNSTDDYTLVDVPDSYQTDFEEAANQYDSRDLLRLLNLTLSAQYQFRNAVNQRIFVENFLLKLVHFTESVTLDNLVEGEMPTPSGETGTTPSSELSSPKTAPKSSGKKIKRDIGKKVSRSGRNKPTSKQESVRETSPGPEQDQPEPEGPNQSEPTPEPGTLSLEEFQEKWEDFAEFVHDKKPILGEYLGEGVPNNVQGKSLEVLFDHSASFHMKSVERKARQVEKFIKKFYEVKVRFKCRAGDTGKKQEQEEEDIIDDPITQAIINNFDGEIIN